MPVDLSSYKVAAGEKPAASAKQNNMIQAIQDALNALPPSQIVGYPGDATKYLDGSGSWSVPAGGGGGGGAVPAGVIEMFGGLTAPTGWLLCDGSAVSRGTYSALFSVLSTRFGAGDGSTTFNLPDLRGRMPLGFAASGGHADVNAVGNNEGGSGNTSSVALGNRRSRHKHDVYDPGHHHSFNQVQTNQAASGTVRDANLGGTDNTGDATTGIKVNPGGTSSSNDPNNTPAYVVLNFIVKT